jgi:hypothetical protein
VNALDNLIRRFLGRHGFCLISLMRTLPSVGKLKLAGKNMSRLGTQIDRRLAAEPSVTETQDQALGNLPLRNLWRYKPPWVL